MAKLKSWVRRLTLAPIAESRDLVDTGQQADHGDEERNMLQREQMARATDISLIAGQGKRQRPHIHGVEKGMGSKFWATGDDYSSTESVCSSNESDDEDETSSPTLAKEALEAGFTLDQIRHAETELDTPPTGTSKVCAQLQEGSISKQIVDAWVFNRRKQGNPWRGPLRPPRQSPPRTLGDAMAKAKFVDHRKAMSMSSRHDTHRVPTLSDRSSIRQRHEPAPVVTGQELDRCI
jgi:hypothetical protein